MLHHLVIILVIIVHARVIVNLLQVVGTIRFNHIQTVVSLVVTIPVGSIVLVCIYLILLRLRTSTIIIEHGILSRARIIANLHLPAVLKRQVLLPLPIVLGVRATWLTRHLLVLEVHRLLVVVLLRLRTVRRVLERQLGLRLVDVLLLEVFVIIIEYLVIDIEVLSRV